MLAHCDLSAQAAPDVRIGEGQRRRAPKILSKLAKFGGLEACPLGNFFSMMQNAANWAIFSFLSGLRGAWPPLGAAYGLCNLNVNIPVLVPVCENMY